MFSWNEQHGAIQLNLFSCGLTNLFSLLNRPYEWVSKFQKNWWHAKLFSLKKLVQMFIYFLCSHDEGVCLLNQTAKRFCMLGEQHRLKQLLGKTKGTSPITHKTFEVMIAMKGWQSFYVVSSRGSRGRTCQLNLNYLFAWTLVDFTVLSYKSWFAKKSQNLTSYYIMSKRLYRWVSWLIVVSLVQLVSYLLINMFHSSYFIPQAIFLMTHAAINL